MKNEIEAMITDITATTATTSEAALSCLPYGIQLLKNPCFKA